MGNESTPDLPAANLSGGTDPLELDPDLVRLAERAVAAGLNKSWYRFKNFKTGEPEGPCWLKIDLPQGRQFRSISIHAGDAEMLAPFNFERWTALGGYEAILDVDNSVIIAEIRESGLLPFSMIPGIIKVLSTDAELEGTHGSSVARAARMARREPGQVSYLRVPALNGRLSLELYSFCPPEIAAINGRGSTFGNGLAIRGVTTKRHDEALELLLDLSTSFFIDLDIRYGIKASLKKAYDADIAAQDGYDRDVSATAIPQFPNTLHNRDAASLYLYARQLLQMPLLEYLVYYQVIEFYLPTYTRSAMIARLRNMLKDPGLDYNNDLALGRLLDAVTPTDRKPMSEREQVAATIAYCVDDAAITAFLEDKPSAARALCEKNRIRDIRLISPNDRQTPLTRQVAERIYDLRCRIVHSKESASQSVPPIRPFGRESGLMRHDLALIRLIAQKVLIASSRPASW